MIPTPLGNHCQGNSEVGGSGSSLMAGQVRSKDIDYLVTGIPYRDLCTILEDLDALIWWGNHLEDQYTSVRRRISDF
jgi:hypothetical protein